MDIVQVGPVAFGAAPLALIAGPCVIESGAHALELAHAIADIAAPRGVPYVFKASFDKANRTSSRQLRGPGLEDGLRDPRAGPDEVGVPVLTDIHEPWQAAPVAAVVDVLQIPAFLCRQTDLLVAAARTGKAVNVKKGQFLAPEDMRHVVEKLTRRGQRAASCSPSAAHRSATTTWWWTCAAFRMMRALGCPVIFDATHSVQLPGAGDGVRRARPSTSSTLARAGVAAGVDGVFLEVHEDPDRAPSDGENALRLDALAPLLRRLVA